jgi:hypothetical protein
MDKASIIADAVVYVRNLQLHARKLKEEVATLEAAAARSPAVRQQHMQSGSPAAKPWQSSAAGRRRLRREEHGRRRRAGDARGRNAG